MNDDSKQWSKLLQSIANGVVIPIVGRDLLRIEIDGRQQLLYEYLAAKLAAELAGQIAPGPKLGGVADLLKVLNPTTYAFLKKRADTMPGLSIHVERVGRDGRIELRASGSISSGERKGDTLFSLAESVQLQKTAAGLRAEVLKIRRLPNEP
ncbi:MAG: hypothetical protein QOF24_67 [Verrucomicrobiota bacterium]|jgi:hypothetical protein